MLSRHSVCFWTAWAESRHYSKCIHIYRLHEWPFHPNTDEFYKYFRYPTCFEHFWIIVGDKSKKVKFSVPTSWGHVGGGGARSCTHSQPRYWKEVSGEHSPAVSRQQKNAYTHRTGICVGPRASLDIFGEQKSFYSRQEILLFSENVHTYSGAHPEPYSVAIQI